MSAKRFVILHHLSPQGEHWDLMLEDRDRLATWRLDVEPVGPEVFPIACTRIGDHRKRYLDYEGPISGGRGFVTRVDQGEYDLLGDEANQKTIRLAGVRLSGEFCLSATGGEPSAWVMAAV